jgi:hypothetical protein
MAQLQKAIDFAPYMHINLRFIRIANDFLSTYADLVTIAKEQADNLKFVIVAAFITCSII